jgi:hypothetical protein
VTLGDLVALGAVAGLLTVFSLGRGWTARARVQIISWAAVAFAAYANGPTGAASALGLLCVALLIACARQRIPRSAPIRELPVDISSFPDRARLSAFLAAHGFEPFVQLSSTYATGKTDEEVWKDRSGTLFRLTVTRAGGATGHTAYFESWFGADRSVRTSDQLRWEAVNDRARHPLHQHIVDGYEQLYARHAEYVARAEGLSPPADVAGYLSLRKRAYANDIESSMERGLLRVVGDDYRFTLRAAAGLIWQVLNLPGAFATERHW